MKWLLDSDPAIRWHVSRDLADAPPEIVTYESWIGLQPENLSPNE